MVSHINDFIFILPELFLILGSLVLLSIGVLFSNYPLSIGKPLGKQIGILSVGLLFLVGMLIVNGYSFEGFCFDYSISKTVLINYVNILVTLGGFSLFILWFGYIKNQEQLEFELLILFIISILGSYLIISSNDFLSTYLGIELQGLCLYIMAAFKTNSSFSTEAGVKYFILGGLASSFLIFGISLIYGFTGLINFTDLQLFFNAELHQRSLDGLYIGFFFLFVGFLFKVGGAPFHVWVPDVYEGSPMIVTAFFAIIPKISIFIAMVKVTTEILVFQSLGIKLFILYSSILSTVIGSIAALSQTSLKRLISYSAIAQSGFILLGLSTFSSEGIASILIYLTIYVLLLVNLFACILASSQRLDFLSIQNIGNLKYIGKSNALLKYIFSFSIFSIAGIPPLSGFFSKFLIFYSAIGEGLYVSSVIVLFVSAVSMVYYLRIIRSIMFVKNYRQWMFMTNIPRSLAYIIVYTGMFNVLFIFILDMVITYSYTLAVGSLL